MDQIKSTGKTYGLLWDRSAGSGPMKQWHYTTMQAVIDEPIITGKIGIEVGSGCGYDTYLMASRHPAIKLLTIDISDGIFRTKELVNGLENVLPAKCSALEICAKDASFDFAYSFGVLHHTPDPKKGMLEISRVLKCGSRAFVYLYEDHSENIIKYLSLKVVSACRAVTKRLPKKLIYLVSCAVSPLVFLVFSVPAKILARFKATEAIAEQMPFNFAKGPFSLRGDLYDRFAAPIEHRFSRKGVYYLFETCGFTNVRVTRLKDTAGWVAWGTKTHA